MLTKHGNIGSEKEPEFANIGNYWDEDTLDTVVELLHEYQDLFPSKLFDLKRIVRDLGMMKLNVILDAKPVKQFQFWLNPKYKEKVREELNKLLAT